MDTKRVLKGVNKGFRFKGLIGKYVIAVVGVIFVTFISIMLGSIFVKNMFMVVGVFVLLDVFLIMKIFSLNKKYGENGLEIALSGNFKPKMIKIDTRNYAKINYDTKEL